MPPPPPPPPQVTHAFQERFQHSAVPHALHTTTLLLGQQGACERGNDCTACRDSATVGCPLPCRLLQSVGVYVATSTRRSARAQPAAYLRTRSPLTISSTRKPRLSSTSSPPSNKWLHRDGDCRSWAGVLRAAGRGAREFLGRMRRYRQPPWCPHPGSLPLHLAASTPAISLFYRRILPVKVFLSRTVTYVRCSCLPDACVAINSADLR